MCVCFVFVCMYVCVYITSYISSDFRGFYLYISFCFCRLRKVSIGNKLHLQHPLHYEADCLNTRNVNHFIKLIDVFRVNSYEKFKKRSDILLSPCHNQIYFCPALINSFPASGAFSRIYRYARLIESVRSAFLTWWLNRKSILLFRTKWPSVFQLGRYGRLLEARKRIVTSLWEDVLFGQWSH